MVISGMKKIKTLCILSALMVGLMVAISVVSAQTNPQRTIPPIVNIGPSGNVLIRGTVTNIGSDSLEVKSWGGKWTIKISADTAFYPERLTLNQIQVNDQIGIKGKIESLEDTLTVTGKLVRDYDAKVREPRNYNLTVQSVDTANNTITARRPDAQAQTSTNIITVRLSSQTTLVDRVGRPITLSQIGNEHHIQVYGVLIGSNLDAQSIKDLSLETTARTYDLTVERVDVENKTITARRIVLSQIWNWNIQIQTGTSTITVRLSEQTTLADKLGNPIALSQIKKDHQIRVYGVLNDSNLDAQSIRDLSLEKKAQIYILTVESVDSENNTITAKTERETITVTLTANTQIYDKYWRTITLSQIQPQDTIRVYGYLEDSTLNAQVIRDKSIPRNQR
jgi:uncharacterized protein YdeI (BOF family)